MTHPLVTDYDRAWMRDNAARTLTDTATIGARAYTSTATGYTTADTPGAAVPAVIRQPTAYDRRLYGPLLDDAGRAILAVAVDTALAVGDQVTMTSDGADYEVLAVAPVGTNSTLRSAVVAPR